jgi:hypothetical protein
MFWKTKKKEPLDYPSVEVYKSLRQQRVDMENAVDNAEYEYALSLVRSAIQQEMWKGHNAFLVDTTGIKLPGVYDSYFGLSKERWGSISQKNLEKVVKTLVDELVSKGYTGSAYGRWNDRYKAITVSV